MEISTLGLIGIALGTMFFGYFFGLFEGRGQGYKRRRNEEMAEGPKIPIVAAPPVPPRQNMLELGRDDRGQPRLHLDGREVGPIEAAPEQRKRLIELMVMLRPWVEPSVSAVARTSTVAPEPRRSAVVGSARDVGPLPEVAAGVALTQPPSSANLSLVAQIDSILQMRLVGTPLARRGIRLSEALHGGAIVFIGAQQYDGVEKVPDPEIQAAIRAAIAEWERGSVPR